MINPLRVSHDYQPITWVGRFPVFLTFVLVAVHVTALIAASVIASLGAGDILTRFDFNTATFFTQFEGWTAVSYAFLHKPDLWFVLEMLAFFWFGQDVERFLGRKAFLGLYLLLILLPPTCLLVVSFFGYETALASSQILHLTLLAAFALIYPTAELIFRIQASWIALALVGLALLQMLSVQAWGQMVALWTSLLGAFFCLHFQGVATPARWMQKLRVNPAHFAKPRQKPRSAPPIEMQVDPEPEVDPMERIDPLLDKIRERGLASLSAGERRQLENYRSQLLAKTGK